MCNARKIEEAAAAAHALCGYEGDGAGSAIGRALREIKSVSAYDETLQEYERQLLDIDSLLNDYNREMAAYLAGISFDGAAFEQTETRLNLVNHLKAKYGSSVEAVLAYQAKAQETIEKYRDYDAYREKLAGRVEESWKKALVLCKEIAKIRKRMPAHFRNRCSRRFWTSILNRQYLRFVWRAARSIWEKMAGIKSVFCFPPIPANR